MISHYIKKDFKQTFAGKFLIVLPCPAEFIQKIRKIWDTEIARVAMERCAARQVTCGSAAWGIYVITVWKYTMYRHLKKGPFMIIYLQHEQRKCLPALVCYNLK